MVQILDNDVIGQIKNSFMIFTRCIFIYAIPSVIYGLFNVFSVLSLLYYSVAL